MEISLAEGFKAAAVETFSRGRAGGVGIEKHRRPPDDRWLREGLDLLESSRSWISQQALVQALALARSIAPDDTASSSLRDVFVTLAESDQRHPFVCETARLVVRALDDAVGENSSDNRSRSSPEVDVWFEAVEALADGGVTLSPDAHQLLGLSTLLINLAERRVDARPDDERNAASAIRERVDPSTDHKRDEALGTRERIHTEPELPSCFRKSSHAATMHEVGCDRSCGSYLCGPRVMDGALKSRRDFSRTFVQRAQITARSVPPVPKGFPRAVRRAWWALTRHDRGRMAATRAFGPIWKFLDAKLESGEESH
jgi:hypothetical protein